MKEKTSQSYSLRWYTFQIFWWGTFGLLFTLKENESKIIYMVVNEMFKNGDNILPKQGELWDAMFEFAVFHRNTWSFTGRAPLIDIHYTW